MLQGADTPIQIEGAFGNVQKQNVSRLSMSFTTGFTIAPPGGIHGCVLMFSTEDPFPTASTCSMELKLPLQYDLFVDFKEACRVAFTMHGGFGLS